MNRKSMVVIALASGLLLSGCTTNVREAAPGEDSQQPLREAQKRVRSESAETLRTLYAKQPDAKAAVGAAHGYAVFTNIGTKILLFGGGSGKGMAVENATKKETFMRMAEVQAGLGFGVKKFRLVWVFQTRSAFDSFINDGIELGAQASLVAKVSGVGGGVAGAASIAPGVWLYEISDDGLAAEITVKGTKYYRDKGLDSPQ